MGTKIFLAAISTIKNVITPHHKPEYVLESYMQLKTKSKTTERYMEWCSKAKMFLLDSGAFTFINKTQKTHKYNEQSLIQYIEGYIEFINKYDIKHYFELDIDKIIGYENVLKIRKYIEEKTNKKCIPVWHVTRGLSEFVKMCDEYDYVAIGGIAAKEIPTKHHEILYKLCDIAHSKGCKVHGLGYMPLKPLNDNNFPFDTCDGTTWQGHMRKACFKMIDNKLKRLPDADTFWRDNEISGYGVWVDYCKHVENNNTIVYTEPDDSYEEYINNVISECIDILEKRGDKNKKIN